MKLRAGLIFCFISAVALATSAFAEESQFAYVYTTDLLPKGQKEFEQWMTWRHGKSQGDFNVWENRTSLEYGVTDKFQLAGYANYTTAHAFHDGVDGATFPPESFAESTPGPDEHFNSTKFIGVSLEGIYRFLSPYTDPVGFAVYLEPTVGPGLYEMETRAIFQKNFLDDRLIFAFNTTVEQEARHVPGDPDADPDSEEFNTHWDHETDVNFGFAGSYRFAPNWSIGFELQNEREFSSFSLLKKTRTNNAYYLGPTVHYGGKNFFVTVTFLEQLPWGTDYANPKPGFIVDGKNYADDFEACRVRIKAGFYF